MSAVTVHHGDSRDVLKTLADCSVDSVVCDPPYALVSIGKRFGKDGAAPAKSGKSGAYARASAGFMGQKWDTGETAFDPEFWAEVLRVLKPGAHLIAFSGTRTQHRQVCAIEDGGFEVRDTILDLIASDTLAGRFLASLDEEQRRAFAQVVEEAGVGGMLSWAFGSGFPKSHNQSGAFDGWGSALKPAFEPICIARKPLIGTIARNLDMWGVGALNIDGCRVVTAECLNGGTYSGDRRAHGGGWQSEDRSGGDGSGFRNGAGVFKQPDGRWPANVIHDGSAEVLATFPSDLKSGTGAVKKSSSSDGHGNRGSAYGNESRPAGTPMISHGDSGSAARFFYSAKADAEDRLGSKHPTVKPVDLMQWLCRLVTPRGGLVLDPFAGSGSTGLAAMNEGFDCILIEREAKFIADINRRLAWARGEGRLTTLEQARDIKPDHASGADLPLFTPDHGEAAA